MGWIIFFSILLIIVIALAMSVHVKVRIDDEVRISVKYAWLTIISISPEAAEKKKRKRRKRRKKQKAAKAKNKNLTEEKAIEEKTAAADNAENADDSENAVHSEDEKSEESENSEKEKPKVPLSDRIDTVKMLLETAGRPVRRLLKHIRIKVNDADIIVSGKDAASAALNYGRINWVARSALDLLYEFFTLDIKRINIGVDFVSGKFKYILSCDVKLRLSTALGCAIWFVFRYLKMLLKTKSCLSGAKKKAASGKGN